MTVQLSTLGRHFIEAWEGCILGAYDDDNDDRIVKPGQHVKGTLTIGYGHTTAAGAPKVYVGMTITDKQADRILTADLSGVLVEVEHLVKTWDKLNQSQLDAVISFQYNTGWLGHHHSSMLDALNAGNFDLADHDFMLYDRANGVVLAGLEDRRAAERDLFHMGVYRGPSDEQIT